MIEELKKRRGETDGCYIEEVYSCEYGEMLHDYDVLKSKNKALEERVAELEKQLEGSNALCLERAHIEAYRHKVLRATDMMVREILNLNANAYTLLNKTKEG